MASSPSFRLHLWPYNPQEVYVMDHCEGARAFDVTRHCAGARDLRLCFKKIGLKNWQKILWKKCSWTCARMRGFFKRRGKQKAPHPWRTLLVDCRATGANENSDYWPLGIVSDDGSCYAKANSTISIHSGSDPLGFLIHSGSGPLGQAGPRQRATWKKASLLHYWIKQCCGY